jgi:hypothetical protein
MVSEHKETRVEISVATLPELVKMVAHEALVPSRRSCWWWNQEREGLEDGG